MAVLGPEHREARARVLRGEQRREGDDPGRVAHLPGGRVLVELSGC